MLDTAFAGVLAADAESRTSQSGKPWVRMRVGVGKDDTLQWVSVAAFGKAAEAAAHLKKGDQAYFEGSLKLETWTGKDGVERHGLSVAASRVEQTHLIGKHRPRDDKSKGADKVSTGTQSSFYNDHLPFDPEVR